jgi:hypothetical protein
MGALNGGATGDPAAVVDLTASDVSSTIRLVPNGERKMEDGT